MIKWYIRHFQDLQWTPSALHRKTETKLLETEKTF